MAGGVEVALVTSGAIAAGTARLGLGGKPRSIPEKQAAAAVGQAALMWHYEQACGAHGVRVAQVLLTQEDVSHRERYLNARNTLMTLLGFKVLPVINENDTVAVEEIKVGDNDNLAALVAALIDADLLVAPLRHRRALHGRSAPRSRGAPDRARGRPSPPRWRRRRGRAARSGRAAW